MDVGAFQLRHGVTLAKRGGKWEWLVGKSGFDTPTQAANSFLDWKEGHVDEGRRERKREIRDTLRDLLGLK